MTAILDRVAKSSYPASFGAFLPTSPAEYFALQAAIHLGEAKAAAHYVKLLDQYSEGLFVDAYCRALAKDASVPLWRRFHAELTKTNGTSSSMGGDKRFLAIRIERRTIAVALLRGSVLEHTQVRHLSSDPNKAIESAAAFMSRLCDRFRFLSAGLEIIPAQNEVQRTALRRAISEILRDRAVAIWEVSKKDLFASFAYPKARCRQEIRQIIDTVYPFLNGGYGAPLVRDAAALGLYCQVKRHFIS